jgi:ubiquitin-protein ligase
MSYDNIEQIKNYITSPINNQIIKLIRHDDNVSNYVLHFDVNTIPLKITTDFNRYCLAESGLDTINLKPFNLNIVFKNKDPKNILEQISRLITFDNNNPTKKFSDPFHVYQKIEELTKFDINWSVIEKVFSKNIESNTKLQTTDNKIPKELLLTPIQISQLIINEIKRVNRNKTFEHYIVPDENNPYNLFLRLKFNDSNIFQQIKKDFGYDYMELKLIINPKTHPFIPPKIEYIRPKIKLPLLLSILNLDILKLDNWNPTITLEYFISSLGSQIELFINDYVIPDAITNGNKNISYNELEYELIKLASITKEYSNDKIQIKISKLKISNNEKSGNAYWKAGTGYGNDNLTSWDIKTFIQEKELQSEELANCLLKINSLIKPEYIEIINDSILINYINNQIKGLTMLELEKNKKIFTEIFNILANLADKNISQTIINSFSCNLTMLRDEIDMLFKTSTESLNNEFLLQIYCLSDWYVSRYVELPEIPKEIIISSDIKEKYCEIMKKLQFGSYEIPRDHRFNKYLSNKPEQKSLMRILSEISGFKTNLPLNWESSIWVRVPKNNFNIFSFLISGPKDTPYENGLFEFHAYLPPNYPNGVPEVLIHTTGNGKVRFNPNLYDSGKVCLSLLGTWAGQEGEKWNPQTSTFLQIMVSIQSLILVEQPYFNEPGWEREMNTKHGQEKSRLYSEERQPSTIKLAMTDMINNPPQGFEDVVLNHFRMKKDEIINKTLIWQQNAIKFNNIMEKNRNELLTLLEKL